jgi:hypothetical protein
MEIRDNIVEIRFDNEKDCYLWFRIDGKINEFLLEINARISELGNWSEINAYYFVYETNEYGCRESYIEYVNCFEEIANKLCTEKNLYLFNLNINKEFQDVDKELLKNAFLEINEIIVDKAKLHIKQYLEDKSDDKNNSYDNKTYDENVN